MDDQKKNLSPAPSRAGGYDGPPMRITQDIAIMEPDAVMSEIRRSIMTKAVLISLVAHIILIGLTSWGLYAKWADHGFMGMRELNRAIEAKLEEKKKAAKAENDERLRQEAKKRADQYRLEAAEKKEKENPSGLNANDEKKVDRQQKARDELDGDISLDRPNSSNIDDLFK